MTEVTEHASALTHAETAEILNHLQAHYTTALSLVVAPVTLSRLHLLRALERDGLVEITTVLQEKRWVATPGGGVWRLLHNTGRRWSLQQLLVHPDLCWAPSTRIAADIERLIKWGLLRSWTSRTQQYLVTEHDLTFMSEPVWIEKTDNLPGRALGMMGLKPHGD